MSHFGGKTVLLITGIWRSHFLAAIPQFMVCIMRPNHFGVAPAYVGLGRFQLNVIDLQ